MKAEKFSTPKAIYFATTSKVKFDQYSVIFSECGIDVRRVTFAASPPVEPQTDAEDPESERALVAHPLRLLARFAEKANSLPCMLEDTMLLIDAFSEEPGKVYGLPGPDTKSWWRNLKDKGVLKLLRGETNRRATFICQLGVYLGKAQYEYSKATLRGRITGAPRSSKIAFEESPKTNPFFFHTIFRPDGSRNTLAEMNAEEFGRFDYRRQCAQDLVPKLARPGWEDNQLWLPMS